MIKLIKREDYPSEKEYQEAYEQMLKAIKQHNMNNPKLEYNSNYKEEFLRFIS